MKNTMLRWAFAALMVLPLTGGFAVQPVLAEKVDFVCFDVINEDGVEETLCEPADDIAYECDRSGNTTSPECAAATAEIRPARTWEVPASLSESSDSDSGHGGGVVKPKGPNTISN
jgi:hypothetical protein